MATQATELEALEGLRDAHVAALNAGDADAWVACFTPDGVQMPPNHSANVGRDAIRDWSGGMLAAFRAEFTLAPEDVQPAGVDWAFESGTYAITLTPRAGGDAMRDSGKYITVYQRQDDATWLMARDIWNSNNPLPQ